MMDLDRLRLIVLDERASGKLSEINSETFHDSAGYLKDLYSEARSIDHFMTRRGSELIEEIESVRSTLQDISSLRLNKIIKFALVSVQGGKTDKTELKRMLPEEREMFDEILASIGRCRDQMIGPEGEGTAAVPPEIVTSAAGVGQPLQTEAAAETGEEEDADGYEPVYLKEEIDSFMGLDGRIYSLAKEDIVMLPAKNASVLSGRNIALNIRVGK